MKDFYHETRALLLLIAYARRIKAPASIIAKLTELLKEISYRQAI